MYFSRLVILLACSAQIAMAQVTRLELLSRSDDHAQRRGGSAMSATPEISRDGNFVLFVSAAGNLTPDDTHPRAMNLYMTDRRTGDTTLISVGVHGEAANAIVEGYQFSADNRRILFESAASNLVPDDANKVTDVFVRDLDSNQTILVSANRQGVPAGRGGSDASITADGKRVAFFSSDRDITANTAHPNGDIFLRDLTTGVSSLASVPPAGYSPIVRATTPSISDDGRYVTWYSYGSFPGEAFEYRTFVRDTVNNVTANANGPIPGSSLEPFLSRDGKFAIFGIQTGFPATQPVTNVIVRYSIETGERELMVSNNVRVTFRPLAISGDGRTVLYNQDNSFQIFREGIDPRVFPKNGEGQLIKIPGILSRASLSEDGLFATFSTEVPILNPNDPEQSRTYVYGVEQDASYALPATSPAAPVSDPSPSADGSIIAFSAADAEIQNETEPATHNIYTWERVSGKIQLLSKAFAGAFENSAEGGASFSDRASFSDDGNLLVFSSSEIAGGVDDTNNASDIFVLDRVNHRKILVSVSNDGQAAGSRASTRPVISGDGRKVAFMSLATNLVSEDTGGRAQLFVRDMETGVTRMVPNAQGAAPLRSPFGSHLSFSFDGKLLVFASASTDMDSRKTSDWHDIFIYDTSAGTVALMSYSSNGATTANANCTDPLLSPDGKNVAFRSVASNLGTGSGSSPVYLRNLETGVLRRLNPANGTISHKFPLRFNRASTKLYFGAPASNWHVHTLAANSTSVLVANAVDAGVSDDEKWIAFSRRETQGSRTQVWLRDVAAQTERMISSNQLTSVQGNDISYSPRITADGRFVVFASRATNLIANDPNGATDLFVYDRDRNRLDLVSGNATGAPGNGYSLCPVICPDQTFVAFRSFSSDLVPHDFNDAPDIFAAYFPATDSDTDGVDDRWEIAEFGNLTHDLGGDTDQDGMADVFEFHAGTDPQEAASRLQLFSAEIDLLGKLQVRWATVPGRAYRVQITSEFKPSAWQNLTDAVIASRAETLLEIGLDPAPANAFFRIILVD